MKKIKKRIGNLVVLSVLLTNVGCDQVTKHLAREHIETGESITIISDYFSLTKAENSGAFLSLGDKLPDVIKIPLLMIFPIFVLIGMLILTLRNNQMRFHYSVPIAFIIGGGFGNLYDRILNGSVTDFLHMNFQVFQTGIFNMADVSIMMGTIWLFVTELISKDKIQVKHF